MTMKIATLRIVKEISNGDRESLWETVAVGSIPFLTTSKDTDMHDDVWTIVSCDEGIVEINDKLREELELIKELVHRHNPEIEFSQS